MKHIILIKTFLLGCCLLVGHLVIADNTYKVQIKVNGIQDTSCVLAYHYGDKVYVEDTFAVDQAGICTMELREDLPGGIYLFIVPDHAHFEFLISEREYNFSLETDTSDYIRTMSISGSAENALFNEYQRFLATKQEKMAPIRDQLNKLGEREDKNTDAVKDSIKLLQLAYKEYDTAIQQYREQIIKNEPASFLAVIFRTMKDPVVPETDESQGTVAPENRWAYIKTHFWDNVNFADRRLIRTPILYNKIMYYLDKLTYPNPDSIVVSIDTMIEKSRINQDVFRFTVSNITHKYEKSKVMGMDAVFVHLAEKYYLTGEAFWMNDEQIEKVNERVSRIKPNLIGKKAPNLTLLSAEGNYRALHDLEATYTVLMFWDYKCGHCKRSMPDYVNIYEKYKMKGLKFFSVCTRNEQDKWKAFLEEKGIGEWLNTIDPYNRSRFRDLYDVYSTPVIYLLDDTKTIIAKRISAEQLEDILERDMKEKEGKS